MRNQILITLGLASLLSCPFLLMLVLGQDQGQRLTDEQLESIQCQARLTDRDVTIEKQKREIDKLKTELEKLKKNHLSEQSEQK